MKAKLTVPLAVSALMLLTLPANAICWPWQSCAAPAATQGATATPAPTGTPEKLKSAKKPKATARRNLGPQTYQPRASHFRLVLSTRRKLTAD